MVRAVFTDVLMHRQSWGEQHSRVELGNAGHWPQLTWDEAAIIASYTQGRGLTTYLVSSPHDETWDQVLDIDGEGNRIFRFPFTDETGISDPVALIDAVAERQPRRGKLTLRIGPAQVGMRHHNIVARQPPLMSVCDPYTPESRSLTYRVGMRCPVVAFDRKQLSQVWREPAAEGVRVDAEGGVTPYWVIGQRWAQRRRVSVIQCAWCNATASLSLELSKAVVQADFDVAPALF